MSDNAEVRTVYAGRHLSLVQRGGWEFVTRNTHKPAVGIVAITDAGDVVLVEQDRPAVGRRVIEIPAGLAGDVQGAEDEAPVEAAQRELLEETGYTASHWTQLGSGYSSPGLTDERVVLFLAEGLERQHAGGGVDSESITVHEVPLDGVWTWLGARRAPADLKLLAGLFAAEMELRSRNTEL